MGSLFGDCPIHKCALPLLGGCEECAAEERRRKEDEKLQRELADTALREANKRTDEILEAISVAAHEQERARWDAEEREKERQRDAEERAWQYERDAESRAEEARQDRERERLLDIERDIEREEHRQRMKERQAGLAYLPPLEQERRSASDKRALALWGEKLRLQGACERQQCLLNALGTNIGVAGQELRRRLSTVFDGKLLDGTLEERSLLNPHASVIWHRQSHQIGTLLRTLEGSPLFRPSTGHGGLTASGTPEDGAESVGGRLRHIRVDAARLLCRPGAQPPDLAAPVGTEETIAYTINRLASVRDAIADLPDPEAPNAPKGLLYAGGAYVVLAILRASVYSILAHSGFLRFVWGLLEFSVCGGLLALYTLVPYVRRSEFSRLVRASERMQKAIERFASDLANVDGLSKPAPPTVAADSWRATPKKTALHALYVSHGVLRETLFPCFAGQDPALHGGSEYVALRAAEQKHAAESRQLADLRQALSEQSSVAEEARRENKEMEEKITQLGRDVLQGIRPPQVSLSSAGREFGTVNWINKEKGYGFITSEQGVDTFLHRSLVRGGDVQALSEGQRVQFTPGQGTLGPIAEDVVGAA